MWAHIRHHLDMIDPDRAHLRIAMIVTLSVGTANLGFALTPMWPGQAIWAGLLPVMFGIVLLSRRPGDWVRSTLVAFALFTPAMLIGSAVDPVSPWYIILTMIVAFICGLGLNFGPYWSVVGVISFLIYTASGSGSAGLEAILSRLLAMAFGTAAMVLFCLVIRWPAPNPHMTAQCRFYGRLSQALRGKRGDSQAHHEALQLQPYTLSLWQVFNRADPDRAYQTLCRHVALRNAITQLAEVEGRVAAAGVSKSRLAAIDHVRAAIREVLRVMAHGGQTGEVVRRFHESVERGKEILTTAADEPIGNKLRCGEAIFALDTMSAALSEELDFLHSRGLS